MKRIIFAGLVLILILVGCTAKIPETNPPIGEATCIDCQSKCPTADGNGCVNDKCVCYYEQKDKENNKEENDQLDFNKNPINVEETLPSCGDRMDFLNVSPLEYNDFKTIIPLGNIGGPYGHRFPTDHVYMMVKRAYENNRDIGTANVPLYMPGDARIIEITASSHLSDNPPYKDYDIVFYSCNEVGFRLGHITSLSDELLVELNTNILCEDEYTAGNKIFKRCFAKKLNIEVNSGKEIGTAGGNIGQNALDIWVMDFRAEELKYANPDRLDSYVKHTACPLDYFIEKEKVKLYSLLGGFNNDKRTAEPLCGTIEQDIKGTAQGLWFLEGEEDTYPEELHLALVLDNIDPRINVFSVGMSIPGMENNKYPFIPESKEDVNVAFSKVKLGTIYCYEQADWDFVIVLELLNETTLKIEKQTSSKCSKPFKGLPHN